MQNKEKIKKIAYVNCNLFNRWIKARDTGSKTPIRSTRNSTVLAQFIGYSFKVHNGKVWVDLYVNENMVGYKFGEFVPTRTFKKHGGHKEPVKAKAKGGKK